MTKNFRPDTVRRLHHAMAARVDRNELPGLVTVLARDGEIQVDPLTQTSDFLFNGGAAQSTQLAMATVE